MTMQSIECKLCGKKLAKGVKWSQENCICLECLHKIENGEYELVKTCKDKLQQILTVISKVDNKICPYCHSLLESILGEDNCPSCSRPIYPIDYFNKIKSIINEEDV